MQSKRKRSARIAQQEKNVEFDLLQFRVYVSFVEAIVNGRVIAIGQPGSPDRPPEDMSPDEWRWIFNSPYIPMDALVPGSGNGAKMSPDGLTFGGGGRVWHRVLFYSRNVVEEWRERRERLGKGLTLLDACEAYLDPAIWEGFPTVHECVQCPQFLVGDPATDQRYAKVAAANKKMVAGLVPLAKQGAIRFFYFADDPLPTLQPLSAAMFDHLQFDFGRSCVFRPKSISNPSVQFLEVYVFPAGVVPDLAGDADGSEILVEGATLDPAKITAPQRRHGKAFGLPKATAAQRIKKAWKNCPRAVKENLERHGGKRAAVDYVAAELPDLPRSTIERYLRGHWRKAETAETGE